MKMFQKIQELIDDKDAIVFVLIDEVSSNHHWFCVLESNFLIDKVRSNYHRFFVRVP